MQSSQNALLRCFTTVGCIDFSFERFTKCNFTKCNFSIYRSVHSRLLWTYCYTRCSANTQVIDVMSVQFLFCSTCHTLGTVWRVLQEKERQRGKSGDLITMRCTWCRCQFNSLTDWIPLKCSLQCIVCNYLEGGKGFLSGRPEMRQSGCQFSFYPLKLQCWQVHFFRLTMCPHIEWGRSSKYIFFSSITIAQRKEFRLIAFLEVHGRYRSVLLSKSSQL